MTLRQFHIIFDIAIGVLVVVLVVSVITDRDIKRSYYQDAWKAYYKAEQATGAKNISDSEELVKLLDLYRKVFEDYPDSRWADDAIYRMASRIPPSDEESIILYRRLIRDYPDSDYVDEAFYTIGMGYYDRGRFDAAIPEFGELISRYQNSDLAEKAYFNVAQCRYSLGKWDQAAMEFEDFEIRYPESDLVDNSRTYRGLIEVNREDFERGIALFEGVLADFPQADYADDAQFSLALAYFNQGDYGQTVNESEKLIAEYPESDHVGESKLMIGRSYEEQGKHEESIAALQKVVTDYPNSAYASQAESYLAWIHYTKLKDVAMAIEMNQKIVNNTNYDYDSRKNAQYLIGDIYKLQGDNAKAIEAYNKLLKDFPKPMSTANHPADKIDKSHIIELQEKTPPQPSSTTWLPAGRGPENQEVVYRNFGKDLRFWKTMQV